MTRRLIRSPLVFSLAAVIAGLPLAACDRTVSEKKTTTTKTTETPEGVKKTTETTEKKVETTPK